MLTTLSMTTFVHMIAVIGPAGPPSPDIITEVLQQGRVEGALLPPVLIDALCLSPKGLQALRDLKYIHFAGAPLSAKSAELLTPYAQVVPCVGSTESGGYFTTIHGKPDKWDYLAFQKHAGAIFEKQLGDLHELVFIRNPSCAMQQIFTVYPDRNRFATNDLWVEHPTEKGLWKIIGRSDDYVCLSHGDGLHASLLEPEITAHPGVNNALIGGHGRQSPVLLVELANVANDESREKVLESLWPYIEKLNARCHASVKISPEKVIIASEEKPFIMTIKGSVARMQTLRLYEDEIAALFA
jgi:acyl-coenzyme A synthetase/AMP-(fatty) acid ligase